METLGDIYENRSNACHPKGKTYRDAQLGELVYFITVEHASEHGVVYRGEPIEEKHGEGETSAEWQPPCASG
jgi:hypothetical protein